MEAKKVLRQIRMLILFFMFGLLFAGITAIPLISELTWLLAHDNKFPSWMVIWMQGVLEGLTATEKQYPFIIYGIDWLAYAHIVIAILFIGVHKDPIKNIWIIEWAMWSCVIIFPVAFIFGPIRNIPFEHQLIDCSFGVIGLLVLYFTRKKIKQLEHLPIGRK